MNKKTKIISRYSSIEKILESNPGDLHPGLLFQRFPDIFIDFTNDSYPLKQERYKRLEVFNEFWMKNRESNAQRLLHINRRLNHLIVAKNGEEKTYVTADRLAIGLGNSDSSDIGFYFDPEIGMPSIPGSSVKGLAQAGAKLARETEKTMNLYFGYQIESRDGNFNGSMGNVVFLSAVPKTVPDFDIDIITCHHNHEKLLSQKTPLDCDMPIPVHFLTLQTLSYFVFRIFPANNRCDLDLSKVWQWLSLSLEFLGAGGKTAVGYGSMISSDHNDLLEIKNRVSRSQHEKPQIKRGDRIKVKKIEDPKGKGREVFDVAGIYRGYLKSGTTSAKIGDELDLYVYSFNESQKVVTFSTEEI